METTRRRRRERLERRSEAVEREAERLYLIKQEEVQEGKKVRHEVPFSELTEAGKDAWRRLAASKGAGR